MARARMGDIRMLARLRVACAPESILTPKDTILEHLHAQPPAQNLAKVRVSGRQIAHNFMAILGALLAWAELGLTNIVTRTSVLHHMCLFSRVEVRFRTRQFRFNWVEILAC